MQEPTPDHPAPRRRTLIAAAAAGAGVTVAGVLALGAFASAQDDGPDATAEADPAAEAPPADDPADEVFGGVLGDDGDWAAFDECMTTELGDEWGGGIGGLATEIEELVPDDLEAEIEGLLEELDEEGLDGMLERFGSGELELPSLDELPLEEFHFGDIDGSMLGGHLFDDEAMARFDAAHEACATHLPDEIQEGMAAFEAFDRCLEEQLGEGALSFDGGFGFSGTAVHVEGPDGFEMHEFGENPGTVTITGTADGVVVETDGDITSSTEADLEAEWERFDEAHEACEQHLPEGGVFGGPLFGGELFADGEGLGDLFDGFEGLFDHQDGDPDDA